MRVLYKPCTSLASLVFISRSAPVSAEAADVLETVLRLHAVTNRQENSVSALVDGHNVSFAFYEGSGKHKWPRERQNISLGTVGLYSSGASADPAGACDPRVLKHWALPSPTATALSLSSIVTAIRGKELPLPAFAVQGDDAVVAHAAADTAAPAVPCRVKELVMANDATSMSKNVEVLEEQQASRLPQALTVFRLARGPAIRLVPSEYSSLVFGVPAEMGFDDIESTVRAAIPHASLSLYGVRRGDEASGQLLLRCPELNGFDIRYCKLPSHAPFFNEPPETMHDDVDPTINPDPESVLKKQSLHCGTVAGMEVMATIRRRLGRHRY